MKIKILWFINSLLKLVGAHIEKTTSPKQLTELMGMFKPIDAGINLIRIGGNNDGGYLVPDDLEGIKYCFSPGVSDIATFEKELLTRGITSFLADYSVDSPPISLPGCEFIKKYIGAINDEKTITLDEWIKQYLPKKFAGDLILQMDIEGAEYESLITSSIDNLKKFRIIIVEFHNIDALRNRMFYETFLLVLKRISSEFVCVHVHPNNCCGNCNINGVRIPRAFEATFLRRDRVKMKGSVKSLPHRLDQPNTPEKDDIMFSNLWK